MLRLIAGVGKSTPYKPQKTPAWKLLTILPDFKPKVKIYYLIIRFLGFIYVFVAGNSPYFLCNDGSMIFHVDRLAITKRRIEKPSNTPYYLLVKHSIK